MNEKILELSSYDFTFPEDLIAQVPLAERDSSRLLVSHPDSMTHSQVSSLPNLLPDNAVIVVNQTKVFASRLCGKTEHGGKVEVFLLSTPATHQNGVIVEAIGKPLKKLKIGTMISFPDGLHGKVLSKSGGKNGIEKIQVSFALQPRAFQSWISANGYIPLPPYIKREEALPGPNSQDLDTYQTVFAADVGSVAAPTAGLHFTPKLLNALAGKGISILPITLHVGAGTFLPVKSENVQDHEMHSESFFLKKITLEKLLEAKRTHRPVVCVGTTTLRCLETIAKKSNIQPDAMHNMCGSWQKTNLFLYPKPEQPIYLPYFADALMTNFHQPKSTLFMLICALLGHERAKSVYRVAFENRYRLFSYGDSSLLWL